MARSASAVLVIVLRFVAYRFFCKVGTRFACRCSGFGRRFRHWRFGDLAGQSILNANYRRWNGRLVVDFRFLNLPSGTPAVPGFLASDDARPRSRNFSHSAQRHPPFCSALQRFLLPARVTVFAMHRNFYTLGSCCGDGGRVIYAKAGCLLD